jgi:hypothetical protein
MIDDELVIFSESLYQDIINDSYLFYRNEVRRFTNRNKKELFENWNGYDYYDNEFIGNNFVYVHTNRLYPTIDHKISIYI